MTRQPTSDPQSAPRPSRPDPDTWRGIDAWVFDLDNTLYPSEANLFAQVDARMTRYVADALNVDDVAARRIQKDYYAQYGTTLQGLMACHDIDPHDFLDFVHDIDLSALPTCSLLRERVSTLPGKKLVFTNGSRGHAERVLAARGLGDVFDGIHDITAGGFTPKPFEDAYQNFLESFNVAPSSAAMFEDIPRNLEAPHALGMTTVLVRTGVDWSHEPPETRPANLDEQHAHVHFCTDDLTDFLTGVHHILSTRTTNTEN